MERHVQRYDHGGIPSRWTYPRLVGRRAIFLTVAIFASVGVAVAFVSERPATYLGAKILTGFALGASTVGTQTFVSEITPLPMRGIALSINTVLMVGS